MKKICGCDCGVDCIVDRNIRSKLATIKCPKCGKETSKTLEQLY